MTSHAVPRSAGPPTAPPLLRVDDLRVEFPSPEGPVAAVDGVSFEIERGERRGIAGESGAGKSVTALALLRLLPPTARIGGRVCFDGEDLTAARPAVLRAVRGARIAMVFQDPVTCLNPRLTIGAQLIESLRAHGGVGRRDAEQRAIDLLGQVGIPAPRLRRDEYPHRLSGGMAQRVMIAMALAGDPDLIIADEPTTALDVSIEAQITDLLAGLCRERGTAVILITHDLGVLARFADRIDVMYAGRIVESGPTDEVYARPRHPYTEGLLASIARPDVPGGGRLATIPGTPPSAVAVPSGCPFHPRCGYAVDRCRTEHPPHREVGVARSSACHLAEDVGS